MNRFRDSQIFFASVLGLAGTFSAFKPLHLLVSTGSDLTNGPTMVSLLVPEATLRSLYLLFIILPAALAFLAIGLPLFVIFIVKSFRRGWYREELVATCTLSAALALTMLGRSNMWAFQIGLVAVMVTSVVAAWPVVHEYGYRSGYRLIGVAGLFLLGASYYEYSYMQTGELSIAVAPTCIVMGTFLIVVGLALVSLTARTAARRGLMASVPPWLAVIVWVGVQFSRPSLGSRTAGDTMELWVTLTVAGVLLSAAVASERGITRRSTKRLA